MIFTLVTNVILIKLDNLLKWGLFVKLVKCLKLVLNLVKLFKGERVKEARIANLQSISPWKQIIDKCVASKVMFSLPGYTWNNSPKSMIFHLRVSLNITINALTSIFCCIWMFRYILTIHKWVKLAAYVLRLHALACAALQNPKAKEAAYLFCISGCTEVWFGTNQKYTD